MNPRWSRLSLSALLGVSLLASPVQAAVALDDDLLRTFAQCDGQFFAQMANRPDLAQLGPMVSQPGFANFKLPAAQDEQQPPLLFPQPVQVGELTIKGYTDGYRNLGWQGRVWTWGFVLQGSRAAVLNALPAAVRAGLRQDAAGDWVRVEQMPLAATPRRWLPLLSAASDPVPASGTVERILQLRPLAQDAPEMALLCTLRGFPDAQALQPLRPDAAQTLFAPAYLKQKQQLIDTILAEYAPYSSLGTQSEVVMRAETQAYIQQERQRYAAANAPRPAEFWSALAAADLTLRHEMNPPLAASQRFKQRLHDSMLANADLDDLQGIANAEDPKWPYIIMYGLVREDAFFAAKRDDYASVYLQRRAALWQPLQANFGLLPEE